MYVEKTTAEERGIIGSKVEGLISLSDLVNSLSSVLLSIPILSSINS